MCRENVLGIGFILNRKGNSCIFQPENTENCDCRCLHWNTFWKQFKTIFGGLVAKIRVDFLVFTFQSSFLCFTPARNTNNYSCTFLYL